MLGPVWLGQCKNDRQTAMCLAEFNFFQSRALKPQIQFRGFLWFLGVHLRARGGQTATRDARRQKMLAKTLACAFLFCLKLIKGGC